MSKVKKSFSIAFGDGICGLEILFDPNAMEFVVGTNYYSPTAKKFKDVLPGARILSLNDQTTKHLKSMEDIQNMFKQAGDKNKVVVFDTKLNAEGLAKLQVFDKEEEFNVLPDQEQGLKKNEYRVTLPRRPLGFTIAATSRGNVEVVQVDSVHEEDLKLGSVLISVNQAVVADEASAIDALLKCEMPCILRLAQPDDNIFDEKEDESIQVPIHLANFIGEKEDQVHLQIQWSGEAEKRYESFTLPIRKQAALCEIRAKIAAVAQLKYKAVNLIAKGKLLRDDATSIQSLGFKKGESNTVRVVVSQSKQNAAEPQAKIDNTVEMQIIGAFLLQIDEKLNQYLWQDIDHEGKNLLHITELDRLLARFMGVYERACYIKPKFEWKHGTVEFNTKENLGLVIEGNEVIMCHPLSQAEKQGILPGWKVVGAEYNEKDSGRKIKFPVDHKSCLQSLKRAKTECANNGFSVLCLVPCGVRYDTQIAMKSYAIDKLNLNDGSQTLTLKHFQALPALFANGAVRVMYNTKPETDIIPTPGADTGAIVRAEPEKGAGTAVKIDETTQKAGVKKGWRVLAIGNKNVTHLTFKQITELRTKLQHPFAPPYYITYAPPL